jgi:hypothetical protein
MKILLICTILVVSPFVSAQTAGAKMEASAVQHEPPQQL